MLRHSKHSQPFASTDILNVTAEEAVNRLHSSLSIGLSEAEAQLRHSQFGPNLVLETKASLDTRLRKKILGAISLDDRISHYSNVGTERAVRVSCIHYFTLCYSLAWPWKPRGMSFIITIFIPETPFGQ